MNILTDKKQPKAWVKIDADGEDYVTTRKPTGLGEWNWWPVYEPSTDTHPAPSEGDRRDAEDAARSVEKRTARTCIDLIAHQNWDRFTPSGCIEAIKQHFDLGRAAMSKEQGT